MSAQREPGQRCPSRFALDRLIAGEQASDDAWLAGHVASCERCGARVAESRRAQAKFDALPDALVHHLRERNGRPPWRGRARGWLLPFAAASAVLMAALALLPTAGPSGDGLRMKGGPHVKFFVRHQGGVRPGADGERVQPGDAIQFVYASDGDMYLAIVSIDGGGKASAFFDREGQAAPIARSRRGVLDRSTVLDATLGTETVYALFCTKPIKLQPLLAELEQAPDQAPRPPDCLVERHRLIKVAF